MLNTQERFIDPTHSFVVEDASRLGSIEKALLLKEIRRFAWYKKRHNQPPWVYYSTTALTEKFPYMNPKSIQRWLVELETVDFELVSRVSNKAKYDRTKSYTITELSEGKDEIEDCIDQNEQWIDQNEQPIPPLSSPRIPKGIPETDVSGDEEGDELQIPPEPKTSSFGFPLPSGWEEVNRGLDEYGEPHIELLDEHRFKVGQSAIKRLIKEHRKKTTAPSPIKPAKSGAWMKTEQLVEMAQSVLKRQYGSSPIAGSKEKQAISGLIKRTSVEFVKKYATWFFLNSTVDQKTRFNFMNFAANRFVNQFISETGIEV